MISKVQCAVLHLTEKSLKCQTSTYEKIHKSYGHFLGDNSLTNSRKTFPEIYR